MKHMGEPFEKALCANCMGDIHHIWWGNGGTIWEHVGTGRVECTEVKTAEPAGGSVKAL